MSGGRALLLSFAAFAGLVLAALVGLPFGPIEPPAAASMAHLPQLPRPALTPAPSASVLPASTGPRADASLRRDGYTLAGAGALFVPASFHSADGAYDLLVHFHGNAELVAESVAAAHLDALVLVINVGTGSAPYEQRYALPAMLDFDLGRAEEAIVGRGLQGAHLRRLALSAWSAGYGAIRSILSRPEDFSRVDAVLLADGLHADFTDESTREIEMSRLEPFVRFAEAAVRGEKLFTMTHSAINEFHYATTTETADAVLRAVGGYREARADSPPWPEMPLARHVMKEPRWLEQVSDARRGLLHVRGYRGYREDDHIAHLAQMSVTVLPELVERWTSLRP
jgi:hypothetical protein